jgi:hypothetical protein
MKKLLFALPFFALALMLTFCTKENNIGSESTKLTPLAPISESPVADRGGDEDIPCPAGLVCQITFRFIGFINIANGDIRIYGSRCGNPCPVTTGVLGTITQNNPQVSVPFSCVECFTLIGNFPNAGPAQIRVTHPDGSTETVSVYSSNGCTAFSPQVRSECLDIFE